MLINVKFNEAAQPLFTHHYLHTFCCKCCPSKYSWRHLSVLCSLFQPFKDQIITDKYKSKEEYM